MNFDTDLHVHTFHSPCGQAEMVVADIVEAAIKRGITRLGITDHFYPFSDLSMFDDLALAIESVRAGRRDSIQVFLGCEAEIMSPGRTTGTPELAESLDYIMVAATHFQNRGITDLPPTDDLRTLALHYIKMFKYAVSLPWANTVAHPFLVIPDVCSPEILDHIHDSDILPLLDMAGENNIAVELSPRAIFPWQLEFSSRFYPLCKKAEVKFTLGSDAHTLDRVGDVRVLRPLINTIGLTEKDFWVPEPKDW